jgi:putative GTP pyrophosphokinase
MPKAKLTKAELATITAAVQRYRDVEHDFRHFAKTVYSLVSEHPLLADIIHSVKWRVKKASHLRYKLVRKRQEDHETGKPLPSQITQDNLFTKIEDLAGVRILHLHTRQMEAIHKALLRILANQQYLVKGPTANTWDDEYRKYFRSIGIKTVARESMYTSVHYIIRPNTDATVKCELQVRTLPEEVWGEVSHKIDYPRRTTSIACGEQLRVLARVTSGCTRLVDSIFESHREYKTRSERRRRKRKKKKR